MVNPDPFRIDRLEALVERLLEAIELQQQQRNQDRQEFLDSTRDVVGMIGGLAEDIGGLAELARQTEVDRQQAAADRLQAATDRFQAERDRQEFRSYMRGLQTENNRILRTLEQLLERRSQPNGDS